ncbi:5-oxoproline transporter, DUF969 family subunit [Caulobacter sp. S45]|uniref:5-oxoproline transporter, DUF969 family subunit n=1 Tax=Caulobacter sp. S45 TaxID=1641861 RepID=UPI001576D3D9|nr:DUF969 family protein [Caulobacter sp. S45]
MAGDGLALIGVAVLVASFLLRLNPLLAVVLAALSAGLAAGLSPLAVLKAFGHAFNANRYVGLVWLILPVVGLLERHGLQARAKARVAALKGATAGRVLLAYLALRQVTAALGLAALGGHAQMVRPLLAPMAEAAAEAQAGGATPALTHEVRAYAASADNVGAFFGEDIFIAMSSILLIRGVLQGLGVDVEPLRLSLWAIPTASAAFAVHGWRLLRLDRRLRRLRAPGRTS